MMRSERFTEQAQEALALSQEIVRQYGHSQWDVEHIMAALLRQEESLTVEILKELGVDSEKVKEKVESVLESSPKGAYEGTQIYATPRVASVLQTASNEADRLKDEFVGTEHIFIGIATRSEERRVGKEC